MAALVWFTVGLSLWHFTVFVPDRFWGGIVGAFIGALVGSVITGLLINGFVIPGQSDTTLATGLEGIPGALLGIAAMYYEGVRRGLEPLRL